MGKHLASILQQTTMLAVQLSFPVNAECALAEQSKILINCAAAKADDSPCQCSPHGIQGFCCSTLCRQSVSLYLLKLSTPQHITNLDTIQKRLLCHCYTCCVMLQVKQYIGKLQQEMGPAANTACCGGGEHVCHAHGPHHCGSSYDAEANKISCVHLAGLSAYGLADCVNRTALWLSDSTTTCSLPPPRQLLHA